MHLRPVDLQVVPEESLSLIVKTATPISDEGPASLEEKVAKGTTIWIGDEIFVWTAETQGGVGLIARGEVVEVNSAGEDRRQTITIRPISRNPSRPYTTPIWPDTNIGRDLVHPRHMPK
jgi:hypothetical protein